MEEQKKSYEEVKAEHLRKKEERKTGARHAEGQGRFIKILGTYAIVVIVLGALGYGIFLFARDTEPKGEDMSRAVSLLQAGHIPNGSPRPEYNSNPPTSGPHYAQTVRSGFRRDALPDQNVVHNLEHGDVWISYNPRVPEAVRQSLRKFGAAKVVITPREENETDIALAAWGRLDTFNLENGEVPVERIKDFIKRYVNKGPERIPGASGGI